MSSIIDASDFTDILTELRGNSTMQGTVTALYEIGKLRRGFMSALVSSLILKIYLRVSFWCHLHARLGRLARSSKRYH